MHRDAARAVQNELAEPALSARFVRRRSERGAPARQFAGGHSGNLAGEAFGQSRPHFALGADERDEQRTATRVHLMRGIGAYPYRPTLSPRFLRSGADEERPAQGHQQLDTVMPVRRRFEARAPDDHHRGPGCHAMVHPERHARIVSSRANACKPASSFKTNASVPRYDDVVCSTDARSSTQVVQRLSTKWLSTNAARTRTLIGKDNDHAETPFAVVVIPVDDNLAVRQVYVP